MTNQFGSRMSAQLWMAALVYASMLTLLALSFNLTYDKIMGTVSGQSVLGVWFGDYRQLIPILVIAVTCLLRPEGLKGENVYSWSDGTRV